MWQGICHSEVWPQASRLTLLSLKILITDTDFMGLCEDEEVVIFKVLFS